jgi:hypothetical protein
MTAIKADIRQLGKTKSLEAAVEPVESENPDGEFKLILSKDNLDRDEENLWADEWMHPLPPKIHMDSDHAWARHQSVPLTVGSGVPSIDENGDLVVKGVYADTEHAQMTRRLVNKKHIWQASVSYMDHLLPDGRVVRELLNGTFTGVPANPQAVIVESKGMGQVAEQTTGNETVVTVSGGSDGDGSEVTKTVESKDSAKAGNKPYGNVRYADPGYQDDKKARYPIDTEEHVKAALSYFGKAGNRAKYSAEQQKAILGRIRSAARRLGIDVSDKALAALLEGTTMLIKMKDVFGPWAPRHDVGHTVAENMGAVAVGDADGNVDSDGDEDQDGDDDGDDDDATEFGDVHQMLAQACHDMACTIRDAALQLGAQTKPDLPTVVPTDWEYQGWGDKDFSIELEGEAEAPTMRLLQGETVLATVSLKDYIRMKANPGRPIGPYQGAEGMSGENASGTTPGASITDGELFLKGTAGPAITPEMKSVDTDADTKSLPSSTDDTDAAASDKDAAASVSPADAAARAKVLFEARKRNMQFENALLDTEV